MRNIINERVKTLFFYTEMFDELVIRDSDGSNNPNGVRTKAITIGRSDVKIELSNNEEMIIPKEHILKLELFESIKMEIFTKASVATYQARNLFDFVDGTLNLYNEYLDDREREYRLDNFPY